jgi:putative transcriptional regulator
VTITHHLDDATIIAYAAGTLGEAHGLAVATHLAYCNTCRAAVRQAESFGGELMQAEAESAVTDSCRAATLASLDAMTLAPKRKIKPSTPVSEMPVVLANLLGNQAFENLKWKTKAPGIASFEIPLSSKGSTHLQLLRIGPGKKMPEHGHGGEELTVVLRGSYSDHTGRYRAGDVADLDEDMEHQPVIDSDVDCICLVATEAPTRFKSIWARLAQPFIGI